MKLSHPTRAPHAIEPGKPLLSVQDVTLSYGAIDAVRDLSLEVFPGEVVALVGGNGAGKTTTLRAIAGLHPSRAGEIAYAGRSLGGVDTEARVAAGISMVPEGRGVFSELTVAENLDLGAYTHRDARAMAETRAATFELFPRLGERRGQRAGTLSGGEQQMLAIGRALMARPALLLLDEPSLGIAPLLAEALFASLRTIASSGVTILLVEQNTRLALSLASRAYVLRAGEVVLSGTPSELQGHAEMRAAYLGDGPKPASAR